jgi:hypothetical protein
VRLLFSSESVGLLPRNPVRIVDKNLEIVEGNTDHDVVFRDETYVDKLHTLALPAVGLSEANETQTPSLSHLEAFIGNSNRTGDSWVPWSSIYSAKAFQGLLEKLENDFAANSSGGTLNYYWNVFRKQDSLFESLRRLCFSKEVLASKRKEFQESVHFFSSFTEDHDQAKAPSGCAFANVIRYNRSNTVTGRLTTASGPNLLLLAKQHRDVVKSVFGDQGEVILVDLKSLEPRLVLIRGGCKDIPADVYEHMRTKFEPLAKLPREDVKSIGVDTLYGSGIDSLTKKFPGIPFEYVGPAIDSFFGLTELRKSLMLEARGNGEKYLTNTFGRRVSITDAKPYKFLNRVTQSAAVDLAHLLFAELVSELQVKHPSWKIRPIGMIHDALALDVTQTVLRDIATRSTLSLSDQNNPLYGFSFPITVTKFNAT